MRSLRTLDIVEKYFDVELSEDFLRHVDSIPPEHFHELNERLTAEHEEWGAARSADGPREAAASGPDHIVIGGQNESLLGNSLLYFRQVSVLDPLDPDVDPPWARRIHPSYLSLEETGFVDSDVHWRNGLRWLTKLRPLLVGDHGVSLVSARPAALAERDEVREVQRFIAEEDLQMSMSCIPHGVFAEYRAMACRIAFAKRHRLTMHLDPGEESLMRKLDTMPADDGAAVNRRGRIRRFMLGQHDLPTPVDASLANLLAIRRDDAAFEEFRTKLSRILCETYDAFHLPRAYDDPGRQLPPSELAPAYLESALAQLHGEVRDLKSKVRLSVGEKFFIPAGVGLTIGLIAHLAGAGSAAAIATGVAAPAATTLIEAFRRSRTTSGPSNELLLQNYVSLIDAARAPEIARDDTPGRPR